MNLTIGNKTLEITSCTRRRDTKRGFFLDITIPKDAIGMDELYSLLDGCTEDIVVEDNGTVNTYTGFKTVGSFTCENGVYNVAQVCTSEYEAQLSLAQSRINEQDQLITVLQAENLLLTEELLNTQLALCELYEQSL